MRVPRFLIVGTPRSGTTLVQRLVSELDGVRVPPETHFFTDFVWVVRQRWVFPLEGTALREALHEYCARPYLRGLRIDPEAIAEHLGGSCPTMLDLYSAVVTEMAGPADLVGEKTPGHLLWWRPLTAAAPQMKLICVVRDPRAVVASQLNLGWSRHHVMTAQRWRDDVRRIRAASEALGEERCLVLRYEDVLESEDRARSTLAGFLGALPGSGPASEDPPAAFFAPWEQWKAGALGPADPSRAAAWRDELGERQVREIEAVCSEDMSAVAYPTSSGTAPGRGARVRLPPTAQLRRLQYRVRRFRRERGISQISGGWRQLRS